jgi:hypothetical protein
MMIATKERLLPPLADGQIEVAEARLARLRKLTKVEFLRFEDYCAISRGPDGYAGVWGTATRPITCISYGDLKEGDCPDSAGDYLRALSTDIEDSGEVYFYVPYSTGSEGSGSTVERSNYLCFLESHKGSEWVYDVHGGFGTYAVAVSLTGLLTCDDDTADSILDELEGLEDYPVLDEQALSELEMELSDEAWETCYARDFAEAVKGKFDDCADLELPADLRTFFEGKREEANCYWENEGYGYDMSVNLDRVVECITYEDVVEWAVCYRVSFVSCGAETEDCGKESEAIARVAQLRASGSLGAFYTIIPPATPVQKDIAGTIQHGFTL